MSRFPTAAHLAAWAGLAPAMHESAGRQTPAGKRHCNKWLTAMLIEAAGSVGRMHNKNYLAVKHARLTRRRGMRRALAPPLPRVARRVARRPSPHGRALTGEPPSQELRSWAVSRCASKNFVICRCGFRCPQGGGRVTG
jgi:hypothetical protein